MIEGGVLERNVSADSSPICVYIIILHHYTPSKRTTLFHNIKTPFDYKTLDRHRDTRANEWALNKTSQSAAVQEHPATDVHAQFSAVICDVTRIAFGQSAARAQHI